MAPKSAAISTLPGAAQTTARAMSPSTVRGLPYCRRRARSPARTASTAVERDVALVLLQVLQLRAASAPAAGTGAVHSHGAAHAVVSIAGVGEDALVFAHRSAGAVASELEYRAGCFVGFGGEHRADRALAHAGHCVAALVGIGQDAAGLVDRGDRAFGQFLQRDVDGVALAHRHVARGGGELAIGANAAAVDDGVEDLVRGARLRSAA